MLNGRAPALAGCDAEDVCDCEATTRSPCWNCKIESFGSPNVRAFAAQQLRPKINIGFDIGQKESGSHLRRFCVLSTCAYAGLIARDSNHPKPPGPHKMEQPTELKSGLAWRRYLPPLTWLAHYQPVWLTGDFVAGVTLAAYAIPVALAYATLAGLPPQVGIYGYLLGGLGYALLGSSRQLAVGPTSAISLMVAGTVGEMAGGRG